VSWLDIVLVAIPPALAVLGAERRLMGLALGVASLALLRPLVVLGTLSPILALVVALVAGVAVTVIVRALIPPRRTNLLAQQILGGMGGFAMGSVLVLTLVTALPVQRNPINEREIFYPPRNLTEPLGQAVTSSRLVELGRDILLFPLLDGRVGYTDAERTVYGGLHSYLVVGTPWER
jgi:hypothetical protein